MGDWWHDEIVEPGKLPLFLCAVAFIVTFALTRVIVRSIRAGRGPFGNNVVGGVHVHHVVPGVVLMVLFGLVALGSSSSGWQAVAGAGFGVGLALVLDEFALILHLDDVYWREEGRTSVDAVFLVGGVLLLLLLGTSPGGVDGLEPTERTTRLWFMVTLVVDVVAVTVALFKGKLACGVLGLVVPVVAWVAAIRLARPHSPWARRRYADRPTMRARSEARESHFERRWRSKVRRVQDAVAGTLGG